jgi:hypothetical protein
MSAGVIEVEIDGQRFQITVREMKRKKGA